jgi:hypothetical protein
VSLWRTEESAEGPSTIAAIGNLSLARLRIPVPAQAYRNRNEEGMRNKAQCRID